VGQDEGHALPLARQDTQRVGIRRVEQRSRREAWQGGRPTSDHDPRIVHKHVVAKRQGARGRGQVGRAVGPSVGLQRRGLELPLGPAIGEDRRVGSPKLSRLAAVLGAWNALERGVIDADHPHGLEPTVSEAQVGGGEHQRHRRRNAGHAAHPVDRVRRDVHRLLDPFHRRVHDPHVGGPVLGDDGETARHHAAEERGCEGDEERGEGDAEQQPQVLRAVADEHLQGNVDQRAGPLVDGPRSAECSWERGHRGCGVAGLRG